jgi:hypothetical protein
VFDMAGQNCIFPLEHQGVPADIDLVSWRENHVEHIGKPRRREVSIPP